MRYAVRLLLLLPLFLAGAQGLCASIPITHGGNTASAAALARSTAHTENTKPLHEVLGYRGLTIDPPGTIQQGLRPYEPQSGRWLSPDPLGHSASLSLYDYCGNDPVNLTDMDGRLASKFSTATLSNVVALKDDMDTADYRSQQYMAQLATLPVPEQRRITYQALPFVANTLNGIDSLRSGDYDGAYESLIKGNAVDAAPFVLTAGLSRLGTLGRVPAGLAVDSPLLPPVERAVAAESTTTQVALPGARQVDYSWGALNTYREGGQMTAIEHINYRHAFESGFSDVSRFAEGTTARDIQSFVDQASRYGDLTAQGANGFKLEYNLGQSIGTSQAGAEASGIRIFIRNGQVQTAFPIALP